LTGGDLKSVKSQVSGRRDREYLSSSTFPEKVEGLVERDLCIICMYICTFVFTWNSESTIHPGFPLVPTLVPACVRVSFMGKICYYRLFLEGKGWKKPEPNPLSHSPQKRKQEKGPGFNWVALNRRFRNSN
jgi:hypothetical protein